MKYSVVLFIICAMLGCGEPAPLHIGPCSELFKDVPFTDLEGRQAQMPCQGHRVLVVNFWASWCGPCKIEVPHLVEIAREYKDRGVVVVGVSFDLAASKSLQPAVKALGISYPVLVGGAEQVLERTGIDGIPATLIIAADGTVYRTLVGYHSKEEMLAPIMELLNKKKDEGVTSDTFLPQGGVSR
jgi:thiol-disulfide isomerase/thioredoxin